MADQPNARSGLLLIALLTAGLAVAAIYQFVDRDRGAPPIEAGGEGALAASTRPTATAPARPKWRPPRFTARQDERDRMVRVVRAYPRPRVSDAAVIAAMAAVPRHEFVPRQLASIAYADRPLPIGHDQTISQPYIVAYMTEALALKGTEQVLEVGTGTGYQTAILACLARTVISIERIAELADRARENLTTLGIGNVEVAVGDGTAGSPEHAPFDAVLVTAGTPSVPEPLLEQLAPGGRLIAPVGERSVQDLVLWTRTSTGVDKRRLIAVVFVPLIGEHGWDS